MNAGTCIFGRPEGQESIANGLFKEEKLGAMMYLDGLTDGLALKENESIGFVRHVTDARGKAVGVTIAGIIHHARSFGQDRPGGFVGGAVCFKGAPHPNLINKLLISLSRASLKLIDDTSKKFIHSGNNEWGIKLPEPNNNWVLNISGINLVKQKSKSRLIVQLDDNLNSGMLSSIQASLSNPSYNKFETILITTKNEFLEKAISSNYKVVSQFDLLNYQELFANYNNKLKDVQSEWKKIKEETSRKEQEASKKLSDYARNIESKNAELQRIQREKENVANELKGIKQDLTNEKIKKDQLVKESNDLKNANEKTINNVISRSKTFSNKINELKNEIRSKEQELKSDKKKYVKLKRGSGRVMYSKPGFFYGFGILTLIIGFLVAYLIFSGGPDSGDGDSGENSVPAKSKAVTNTENLGSPKFASIEDYIKQDSTKAIYNFLSKSYNTLIPKDSLTSDHYKSSFYGIPMKKEKIVLENYNFKSADRKEILKQYLKIKRNVYNIELSDSSITSESNIMQHFVWMIKSVTDKGKETDRDLIQSKKTTYVIPLIKK